MPVLPTGGTLTSVGSLATAENWVSEGYPSQLQHLFRGVGYDQLYCRVPSVFTVVSKLAELGSTVPLKTYQRAVKGREPALVSAYGRLLDNPAPSSEMDQFEWRMWMLSTFKTFGEAFAYKLRDNLGRPVELPPLHPLRLRFGKSNGGAPSIGPWSTPRERSTSDRWWLRLSDGSEVELRRRDMFVWKTYNPESPSRGLSQLEPLRDAIENASAAQAAIEALWKQGGKSSFVLSHPRTFSDRGATQRLADQFASKHGGVANWHKPLVLEEGMKVEELRLDDNLQYLDLQRLTDAQVAKVYKLNPAALGDLERATFNNIVEILRDVFRSTMPPLLTSLESALDFQVRDGRFGDTDRQPDFGPAFYAEHELDGVLRGDYEKRADAHNKSIQMGWQTPAEVREMENLPFIEGSDRLFMNSAVKPVETDEDRLDVNAIAVMAQKLYLGTEGKVVLTAEESRALLNEAGANLPLSMPEPPALSSGGNNQLSVADRTVVMGRLSRPTAVVEVDVEALVADLSPEAAGALRALMESTAATTMAELRAEIKELRI